MEFDIAYVAKGNHTLESVKILCMNSKITTALLISDKEDASSSYIELFEDEMLNEVSSIILILERIEKFTNVVQIEKKP